MGGGAADDAAQLQVQVQQLKQQLTEEQLLRRQAEEAVEVVAADRNRLQKARDELAIALLAAEQRAAEAEEEQLRAQAAAAALEQALQKQQQVAEVVAVGAAMAGPSSAAQLPARSGAEVGARALKRSSALQSDSGMAADLEILLTELDQERQRSEELVQTLEAAEKEAVSATEKLLKSQQRIKQLESGGKRGLFGMKKTASTAALAQDKCGAAAPDASSAAAGGEEETVAVLQQRVATLKASRDKLISAFDAQAAEVERLSGDNVGLAEAMAQLRNVAGKWEAQAQDSLLQNERLKDLLQESATWSLPPATPGNSNSGGAAGAGGSSKSAGVAAKDAGAGAAAAAAAGGDTGALAKLCQRFERELLLEKAKSAQLDLQVRALCMELTHAAQSSSQMQTALMPMLGSIEARLVRVLGMRPRTAVLQGTSV